ncbi:hypothetical protein FB451DRAFT_1094162 [Mycena latifolia]|nr:hypothetical protein FB451DRAFT_1094162 [Mycena latifolia]
MSENDSLQRAEALWFSSEVVILQADTRIFRVFAAILRAQSSVFADMFTFPQPAAGSESAEMETMDGVPVVKLHDNPDEVEVFLKAIFDSSFFTPPLANTPLEAIVGILRLSHKYDVPYLRRRALEHLGTLYPTTLSGYDARRANLHTFAKVRTLLHMVMPLQVAAEVGALWLLPTLYYELCTQSIAWFVSAECWKELGERERTACLVGHSAQSRYFPNILHFLTLSKHSQSVCDDWTVCNRLRLDIANRTNKWQDMTCPLDAWVKSDWKKMEQSGICETCMEEAKTIHVAARRAFWDQLPQMFGLPPWAELEEMRRVALATS